MWINNFVNNWIQTSKKIYEAWLEKMNNDKLNFIQFFWRALKQSSIWAYFVFIKWELDNLLKTQEINNIRNHTSNKIAYLIGWYYLSPATLLNLKKELESNWVQAKIIDERYYSKETLNNNVYSLKNKLKEDKWKDIVLFWYSSWWVIAHRIWEQSGYNSVSFGLSGTPNETMVWTLLALTKEGKFNDFQIPKTGKNIIEWFSAIVPQTWDISDNTIKLNNIYSHMTIGKQDVVGEITSQILQSYNTTRV
jgi:hypothetical protein